MLPVDFFITMSSPWLPLIVWQFTALLLEDFKIVPLKLFIFIGKMKGGCKLFIGPDRLKGEGFHAAKTKVGKCSVGSVLTNTTILKCIHWSKAYLSLIFLSLILALFIAHNSSFWYHEHAVDWYRTLCMKMSSLPLDKLMVEGLYCISPCLLSFSWTWAMLLMCYIYYNSAEQANRFSHIHCRFLTSTRYINYS